MFCSNRFRELSVESYKNSEAILWRETMSEQQTGHETEHGSHSTKHMLIMMQCCLLPVIVIIVSAAIVPWASYFGFLFVLICPLDMSLVMLPNLLSKKKKAKESCH